MKKAIKIILIILVILLGVILIDTIQAKVFNNSPLFKIVEDYNGIDAYEQDTGIFVYTYVFKDNTKITVFKWESYAPICQIDAPEDIEDQAIENKISDVEFVRTYNIITNLNKSDATGEYNFYVIQQFQLSEPIVIKVDKKYVLEENENYEFTFKGSKIDGKEYTIQDIFATFDIINIEKTDKIGLEQRQDGI